MKNKNLKKIGIMGLTSLMSLSPMLNVVVEVKAETFDVNRQYDSGRVRLPLSKVINVDTSDFRNFNLSDIFNYTYTQIDAFSQSTQNQISFLEGRGGQRGIKEDVLISQTYTQEQKDELLKDINNYEMKLANFRTSLGNFSRVFGGNYMITQN